MLCVQYMRIDRCSMDYETDKAASHQSKTIKILSEINKQLVI